MTEKKQKMDLAHLLEIILDYLYFYLVEKHLNNSKSKNSLISLEAFTARDMRALFSDVN